MFTSMTARVSTNTYCIATTPRFSRRSENYVGRVTHECEAPTDTVQLVLTFKLPSTRRRRLGVARCHVTMTSETSIFVADI